MKFVLNLILCGILLCSFQKSHAQEAKAATETVKKRNEGTINDQFEYVITRSYTYKGSGKVYKNVQYHWLTELKASTLDSLKALKTTLNDTKDVVNDQAKDIESLESQLAETKSNLQSVNIEKDKMSLFGMQLSKSSYNVLLWSIIAGLVVFLLIFVLRFKTSNSMTKEAKQKLEDVEAEFEEHRRIALEREQKVRRQLQDEINKNKTKS